MSHSPMTFAIETNYTRYDTESILDILEAIHEAASQKTTSGSSYVSWTVRRALLGLDKIEYLATSDDRLATIGRRVIRIKRPEAIFDEYPMEALACAGSNELGTSLTRLVMAELVLNSCGTYYAQQMTLPGDMTITIHDKVVDKKAKASRSDKVRHMHREYGDGGVLTPGSRVGYNDWDTYLDRALEKYMPELERRNKWGDKLRKAGVEPVPYEKASEWLRRMANQLEARGQ